MNASAAPATNPLTIGRGLPPFDRLTAATIDAGIPMVLKTLQANLAAHESRLGTLEACDWDTVMLPLQRMGEQLRWSWGVVGHLMGVCNNSSLRDVHARHQPAVVDFTNHLAQSRPIHSALLALKQRHADGTLNLDATQQRILEAEIQHMNLRGVGLEGTSREAFNATTTRLAELSTRFGNQLLDATKSWELLLEHVEQVAELPPSLREHMAAAAREAGHGAATANDGPWQLGLDMPRYQPFMRYSSQRDLREQAYRAFVSRASSGEWNNGPLVRDILRLRQQQAEQLGFANWAEVSLATKMAASVEQVEQLLAELRRPGRLAAIEELDNLRTAAGDAGALAEARDLQPWDVAYWSEQLRQRRFNLDSEALRPWFPLPRVLEGLFQLCGRLFNIRFEAAAGEAPIWHQDVQFFKVLDGRSGEPVAAFYLDPYARLGTKRGGAWMDECLVRHRDTDGQDVQPVAYLVCNFTPPLNGVPSLLTFEDVETLFHEFGHGLQHMLTTVERPEAAGINNVEWDAIELPSQFMQNWCYDRPTLMGMARHWQTGEPLPDAEYEKLKQARTFMAGFAMVRQLHFALADLELHARWRSDGEESPEALWRRVARHSTVLEPLPEDASLCSFGHIFAGGYAAGYYSYKWAEVLSADAFAAFEEAGLDNASAVRSIGRRFRDTVLSLGGSRHPSEVYRAFRGREPSTQALLRHSGFKV